MMLKKFVKDERAATAIEYGLIVAVLSLAILAGLGSFMGAVHNNFNFSAGIMDNATLK